MGPLRLAHPAKPALKRVSLCAEARHHDEGPWLTGLPVEYPISRAVFRERGELGLTRKGAAHACDDAHRLSVIIRAHVHLLLPAFQLELMREDDLELRSVG